MPDQSLSSKDLRFLQGLSLDEKVLISQDRIRDWYRAWDGKVYVAFSGGKDSTVLLHLVRSIYPDVPATFFDTGLEYPEIRAFARSHANVDSVKPKMPFTRVIKEHGYPVVSKRVSECVEVLRRPEGERVHTKHLMLTGETQDGRFLPRYRFSFKWRFLLEAPFLISGHCCNIMKKGPGKIYQNATGRKPMIGVMASDSESRRGAWLSAGCNSFSRSRVRSWPMAFWTDDDVWAYLRGEDIPYCSVYDAGEQRTGCAFCMFGLHMQGRPNRFQRMADSHPKLLAYCLDKLGLREVLDFIGEPYEKVLDA